MAAPKFNKYWKLRSKDGRDAIFTDPEHLAQEALNYFESCDMDNSWDAVKTGEGEKGIFTEIKKAKRPYTRGGLLLYLGVSRSYLSDFKKTCSEDFSLVIEQIELVIDTQQIEGAMLGVFNANLTARIQGIKDQQDITTNGENINNSIQVEIIKPNED